LRCFAQILAIRALTPNAPGVISMCMAKKSEFPWVVRVGAASGRIYRNKHSSRKLKSGAARVVYTGVVAQSPKNWQKQSSALEVVEAAMRLYLAKVSAGDVQAAGMTKEDRDELVLLRKLAGDDATPVIAVREWRAARDAKAALLDYTPVLIEDAINRFIDEGMANGRQHERTYRSKLTSLLLPVTLEGKGLHPATFRGRHIHTITKVELAARLVSYSDYVTRNDYRKKAIALWTWARDTGHLPPDRELAPALTKRAKEAPVAIGICTPEAYAQLLMYLSDCHPDYLAAAVLAGTIGMRCDEIHGKRADLKPGEEHLRQVWEDILLAPSHADERPFCRVTCAKNNTPAWRKVPLTPAAIAWLETIPAEMRTGNVCTRFAVDRIRAIGKSAGLNLPDNCFRKTCISFRVELEKDKAAIATDAGTSVQKIDSNYRRPVSRPHAMEWLRLTPTHCRSNYIAIVQKTASDNGVLGGSVGGLSRSPAKIAASRANAAAARAARIAKATQSRAATEETGE